MSRRRQRNRSEQRERILSAAFEVFSRDGFEDATMAEVARSASLGVAGEKVTP